MGAGRENIHKALSIEITDDPDFDLVSTQDERQTMGT